MTHLTDGTLFGALARRCAETPDALDYIARVNREASEHADLTNEGPDVYAINRIIQTLAEAEDARHGGLA